MWTSGAQYCHLGLATVRTDPDAPKHAGITTMVIDMHAPGVEVRPLRQVTGNADFNEVFINDVFVPDDDVVGTANDGWTVARSTLGNERVSIGGSVGGMFPGLDIFDQLRRHGDRVPGAAARGGRGRDQGSRARVLNIRRAQRAVVGAGPGPEGNVTKLVVAENGQQRAALQADLTGSETAFLLGDAAFAGLSQLATRGMSIAGGTSEITRNQIAERILGLPRDPLNKYIAQRRASAATQPAAYRLFDDGDRHLDVAPGGIGVRAHLVGRIRQSLRRGFVQFGRVDDEGGGEPEPTAVERADADTGGHLCALDIQLLLARHQFQGGVEAGGVARREELLGVGGAARAAHFLGNAQIEIDEAVVTAGVPVAAVASGVCRGCVNGVHTRSNHTADGAIPSPSCAYVPVPATP